MAAGQPISDSDLILLILGGLGAEFDAVVVNLTTRGEVPSISEVQAILQVFEMRLLQASNQASCLTSSSNPSANMVQNDSKGNSNGKFKGKNKFGTKPKIYCQICGKNNHTADKCYKRFDVHFVGPNQGASTSQNGGQQNTPPPTTGFPYQANLVQHRPPSAPSILGSYGAGNIPQQTPDNISGSDWYVDSGATHHVTSQLSNLSMQSPYQGNCCLKVGDGSPIPIMHTGYLHLPTSKSDVKVKLSNVLHVPDIQKT